MIHRLSAAIALAALFATGCESGTVAPCNPAMGGCTSDADCTTGNVCNVEMCMCVPEGCGPADDCATDADCAMGQECDPASCMCRILDCVEGTDDCIRDADCSSEEMCNAFCQCVPRVCTETDECRTTADCGPFEDCINCRCQVDGCSRAEGDACDRDADCASTTCGPDCECTRMCTAADECRTDADCPASEPCDSTSCTCMSNVALTPEELETLTAAGLPATCHFIEERDCGVTTFDARVTIRVMGGMIEIVQMPGSQTSSGMFGTGVQFSTRDGAMTYDEDYLGEFFRTDGTDPTSPLTPATVVIRALNASGSQGSLAAVDATRIATALADGAHTGNTAAVDVLLADTSGICAYAVECTFD